MSILIIITISVLLLLAYVFDISASRTRIPSVILMLMLGWLVKRAVMYFELGVPSMKLLLPLLGTVGLILIVLEGALTLKITRSGRWTMLRAVLAAFVPMLLLSLGLAWMFSYFLGYEFRLALLNVIPLTVISSSMAVSVSKRANEGARDLHEFESNLSDIFGVLFFNFVSLNEGVSLAAASDFGLQLVLILAVSFAATILLSYLLNRINHPIKFTPIILLVILIFGLSKLYDLPAMLFILLFGLFLGNLDQLRNFRWIRKLRPEQLAREAHKLRDITTEATFLIRSLFFLLFGFLVNDNDLLNTQTLGWSLLIVAAIFGTRALVLWMMRSPIRPCIFVAPGGLITILLYFAIDPADQVGVMNNSLVLQVIVFSAVVMMVGMMTSPAKDPEDQALPPEEMPAQEESSQT